MEHLAIAATVFLILFSIAGTLDGIYFHFWKYTLYSRTESYYEHKLHTIRAILFIPIIYLLFYRNWGGLMLWLGIAVVLIDSTVELMDALCERSSRAGIGGLSTAEYVMHALAITFRTAAIVLILAAKPLAAWRLEAPIRQSDYPVMIQYTALLIMVLSFFGGGFHLFLVRKYRPSKAA